MSPYGIIRELSMAILSTQVQTSSSCPRNDAAIEKARSLSEQHSIKASAYKVDGKYLCLTIVKLYSS